MMYAAFAFLTVCAQQAAAAIGFGIPSNELPIQTCQIEFFDEQGDNSGTCSATLLSSRYLLTAGHCFENVDVKRDPHEIRCPDGSRVKAIDVIYSDDFLPDEAMKTDESLRRFDVALAEMSPEVEIPGMKWASTVEETRRLIAKSSECGVFGYGGVASSESAYGKLRGVFVYPPAVLVEPGRSIYTDNLGDWNSGLVFSGDSGGTLACRDQNGEWTLIGTTSGQSLEYTSLFATTYDNPGIFATASAIPTPEALARAEALQLSQNKARIAQEIGSLKKVLKDDGADVAVYFEGQLGGTQSNKEVKRILADILQHQKEILGRAVGSRVRIRPYSRIDLDFSSLENIQLDSGGTLKHLSDSSNPVSIVDLEYNWFTIERVDGDSAVGELVNFGFTQTFSCVENVLCAPGTYRNVRVRLDHLNFSTLQSR